MSALAILCVLFLAACGGEPEAEAPPAIPIGEAVEIEPPLGLPPVPYPEDNPPTQETIALGRKLYYDTSLSVDGTIACATCHHPDEGFADTDQFSKGVGGQLGGRQAPTVINAAYYTTQFWDGRAPSLEKQAEGPIQNPVEMAHTLDDVEKQLSEDPEYVAMFEEAFGPGRITFEKAGKAIAAFERTVLAANSPFDQWFYGKDEDAVSEAVKRGFEVFRDPEKGNCEVCHSMQEGYALFTDNKFHNLGVGLDPKGNLKDLGRFQVTNKEEDRGAFKTPHLRNIAKTGPYMHDGSLETLKQVIDFYIGAGNSNPWRDKDLKELDHLTRQERDDLEAFLNALTGEIPYDVGPPEEGGAATTAALR